MGNSDPQNNNHYTVYILRSTHDLLYKVPYYLGTFFFSRYPSVALARIIHCQPVEIFATRLVVPSSV